MMIYLKLFLIFFEIGAVSFGGGYGMVSLIREAVLSNGWMSESEFLNFIAVSESTPGPMAVNMATFIGASQCGMLGSFIATLGVVLPAFIIILIIAAAFESLLKYAGVKAVLSGIRPCVVAMILSAAVTMALSSLFGIINAQSGFSADVWAIVILIILAVINLIFSQSKNKKLSPIMIIVISAILGIVFYGFYQ